MARHFKGSKQIISMSLDAELVCRVENLADAKGVSRSQMIEDLIRSGFDQEQFMVEAMKHPAVLKAMVGAFSQPDVIKALLRGMGDEASADDTVKFHQGVQMLGVYGSEFQKGGSAEAVAGRAARSLGKKPGKSKKAKE